MPWNKEKALAHLKANALSASIRKCARYTREAIEAGGVTLPRTLYAKNYGVSLQAVGFCAWNPSAPIAGDVVVIDGFPGNDYGHMAMYDGSNWVSDFVQSALYPGPGYREHQPTYTIYRYIVGDLNASASGLA